MSEELVELARRVQEISDSGDVGRALEGVAARLTRLVNDRVDLQQTFDLQYASTMRAIKLWRVAHPDSEMVWPDRTDLMVWLMEKAAAYDRINTPEVDDFLSAVRNEALHQRERWGVDQDGGKTDADWFWLIGYLAGKALHNVNGKRLHHVITAAAALLNWHAALTGQYARMRPGIEAPKESATGLEPGQW